MNPTLIAKGTRLILDGLGLDLADPNLEDTPDRVVEVYREVCYGLDDLDKKIAIILSKSFPCTSPSLVVAKDVEVFSLCPHHLLPVHYSICVGYLPGEDNSRVLGISKLCRLVKVLGSRPVLQEQLMHDVTAALMTIDGCVGAGCIGKGWHLCMSMRGVAQSKASIVASSLKGEFLTDPTVRAEFMQLFRG